MNDNIITIPLKINLSFTTEDVLHVLSCLRDKASVFEAAYKEDETIRPIVEAIFGRRIH